MLTIRLPGPALRRVKARAAALHTTPSELVRRLLEREVGAFEGEPSALQLTSRWVGCVDSGRVSGGARIRDDLKSWAPDRRR